MGRMDRMQREAVRMRRNGFASTPGPFPLSRVPLPSSASVATPPCPPRARTLRGGDKDEDRALRVGCEGARAVVGVGARREEGVDGALVDVGERRDEAAHVRDQSRNVHRRSGRAAARHRAARAPNNGNAAGRGKRRANVVPVHLGVGEKKLKRA